MPPQSVFRSYSTAKLRECPVWRVNSEVLTQAGLRQQQLNIKQLDISGLVGTAEVLRVYQSLDNTHVAFPGLQKCENRQ